ncbi:arginase family protein [Formosa agariphila KMM 3901]|uniref:Arginase family protein n=1 Tax=Formosa agariphila (strain DSM 15362 / KCTC 12365 / LMG 23005 / KMM 3901 / M-2Alg 35-1) TaxID=1347342 RepID=T2KKG7_FORAG|nr:arginase family protein [Formosa agariphila]CDF78938.1 arginase family protein [Formosa agariphila KMM 3901]
MDKLVFFNNSDLSRLLNIRAFESKFGEHVHLCPPACNIYEHLETLDVKYVLIGLPETIGDFANLGTRKTSSIWEDTLKSLLNIQKNEFTNPEHVLILGHLCFEKELTKINELDCSIDKQLSKARKIVSKIDKHVTHLIYTIKKAGKTPIVIGGGPNNAYGNIKGSALAANTQISAINLDTHSNFKPEEGRHSRNGFTYAFSEGFLDTYFMFGLQEIHLSNTILKTITKLNHIHFSSYDAMEIRQTTSFKKEMKRALSYVEDKPIGIEIDCNTIEEVTNKPTCIGGFSLKKVRQFVHYFGKQEHVQYLHIYKTQVTDLNTEHIGSLNTYLITDFIQAHSK